MKAILSCILREIRELFFIPTVRPKGLGHSQFEEESIRTSDHLEAEKELDLQAIVSISYLTVLHNHSARATMVHTTATRM